MMAMMMVAQDRTKKLQPKVQTTWAMAGTMGSSAIASRSSVRRLRIRIATASTNPTLAMALTRSISERMENIRPSPLIGFILLALGAMALALNSRPPMPMEPAIAATSSMIRMGDNANAAALADRMS